jgi:hypothetical protein
MMKELWRTTTNRTQQASRCSRRSSPRFRCSRPPSAGWSVEDAPEWGASKVGWAEEAEGSSWAAVAATDAAGMGYQSD